MFDNLIIKGTEYTPEVYLQTNGKLLFKGISTPSNIYSTYQPILDWIDKLKELKPRQITLIFHFEYINTSTTKMLLQIIQKCNSFKVNGSKVEIIWQYDVEDEDQLDLGHELESVVRCQFEFVGIKVE